ncbi:hypothetical protein FPV67DRAFT_1494382 [Lyophyllum atratum]|nr:hypothetical protein FPV67DRAFT_1494382 [Lyophyllum atratum]
MSVPSVDIQKFSDILAVKRYYAAAYALLVYDYLITLLAEVEFSWKTGQSLASVLFLLNRYVSLIFSTTILLSYFLPSWTFSVSICNNYAITEFVYTVLMFTIAEVFLALRVYVLTRKSKCLAVISVIHIVAQIGLSLYIMSRGGTAEQYLGKQIPVPGLIDDNAFQLCGLLPSGNVGTLDTVYLSLALSFDAFVFIVTIITTIRAARAHPTKRWLRVIQRDGIMYFMAIFSSTLIWVIFGKVARDSLKLINAAPDLIFTAIMINRLFLSLRRAGREETVQQQFLGNHEHRREEVELQIIISQQILSSTR